MKKLSLFCVLLFSISKVSFSQGYVLVHGWTNDGSIWNGTGIKQLIQNEFQYTNIYQPSLGGHQPAEVQSLNLRNYLNSYNVNSGIGISYSMGGVNTRTYLKRQYDEGLSQRISQHYSIGSPHFGTKLADNKGDAALTLLIGTLSIIYPTGTILDDPVDGLGFTYQTGHNEQFWTAAALLWGGSMLSDAIVDGLLDSPALNDLKTNSLAIENINDQLNYENNLIKVGIAATELDPVLWRTFAQALDNTFPSWGVSENFILDCVNAVEYFKIIRIAWALWDYFDDPNLYNLIWLGKNLAGYAVFTNLNSIWETNILETSQSDGLVSKTSQEYPSANAFYYPTNACHFEELKNGQVVSNLRTALIQFGNGGPQPPIISHFTQSPNPICKDSYGYVYSHLSQGNGDLTYSWSSTGNGISITPYGSYCKVNYSNTAMLTGLRGDNRTVQCTVYNSAGSDIKMYSLILDDCIGCPTLAFSEGNELINENPLLITSLSNPNVDVTDNYLINTEIEPVNDEIKFVIHEPQTEHSWLDYVDLIEAKVKNNEYVAVTDEGEIVTYKKLNRPMTVMLNDSIDITDSLSELDGNKILVNEGDYISILVNPDNSIRDGDDYLILGGEVPGTIYKKIAGTINFVKDEDVKAPNVSEKNINEVKENIRGFGNFFFRDNLTIICNRLENLQKGNLQIVFTKDAELDFLLISKNLKTTKTKELNLIEAVHNTSGDLTALLSNVDESYGELLPGERIDFTFQKGNGNSDKKAYILKTVGRYETDSTYLKNMQKTTGLQDEPQIPLENKLFDNYPNPFNPVTTIKYSLKDDGNVQLKVYNSLGEEVKTLVNGFIQKGNYSVSFNAANLPSGVYIYRIQTGEFTSVKKMLLVK